MNFIGEGYKELPLMIATFILIDDRRKKKCFAEGIYLPERFSISVFPFREIPETVIFYFKRFLG